jgi:DNA-binding SARP family transcriptional activator
MAELQIHFFGRFQLLFGRRVLPDFPTQRAKALFAMLVLQAGQVLPRTRLMDSLWQEADESHARKCLSTELWRIRSLLKVGGLHPEHLIVASRDGLMFDDKAPYWLDVQAFAKALATINGTPPERLGPQQVRALRAAVDLYRGEMLEGVYDDWCLLHREALAAQYLRALEKLMRWHFASGQWEVAIACGQKLLAQDPLLEHIHRSIMRCYVELGLRSAAIRQYGSCVERLHRELGIEPMKETVILYRSICGAQSPAEIAAEAATAPPPAGSVPPLDLALERLHRARRCLAQASRLLTQQAARSHNPNR